MAIELSTTDVREVRVELLHPDRTTVDMTDRDVRASLGRWSSAGRTVLATYEVGAGITYEDDDPTTGVALILLDGVAAGIEAGVTYELAVQVDDTPERVVRLRESVVGTRTQFEAP